ncbi:MAG TPA: QacE family quaternary ammonium compound efflux SMR transporter [Candidatus Agrococcus pullicola]|uniref:QacE family quaternary ammonium compound efflux SMR transporter n=1 Tax=Candidatus Agrococcus pullicola TaxID=2838429 RepID=A0A9D1YWY6_9MICO|nr:QacE family quaternary ammonium compound efflux SMR transporter [Candidatus Agrococcus pullicola]
MDWIVLIISGLLEAVWAIALGASKGFKRWKPTLLFVFAFVASMVGLAYAMLTISVGTAYAVWVGIGAVVTVLVAAVRGEERLTLIRALLLLLLVGAVVGLKVVS